MSSDTPESGGGLDARLGGLDARLGGLDALPVTEHIRVYEDILDQLATELDSGEPAH